jgi:polysaccharide export outer membrane protein
MREGVAYRFRRLPLWIGILVAAYQVPARAQGNAETKPAPQGAQSATGALTKPATNDPNYVIGPQDVIEINVWKEAELTRSVPVRPDGKISMPLLNDVQAGGLTPMQLTAQISAALKKFISDPQVTVVVTQINSQRIFIIGEVTRPGAFPLVPGMTVLEALSSAGGFTMFANVKKIYLLRNVNGKQEKYPFNYNDVIRGKTTEGNVPVKAGDTIVVP